MKKNCSTRRSRLKTLLLPVSVAVPILGGVIWLALFASPEALSPEEILAKENWSDEELKQALSHAVSPTTHPSGRHQEIIQHLSAQLQKRSPEDQELIREGAVISVVDSSLRQIRKMPPDERQRVLNTMQQKAESRYKTILTDRQARSAAARQMQSKDFEVFARKVDQVIFSELTPEEKVQFAPLTRVWMRTMQTMGR